MLPPASIGERVRRPLHWSTPGSCDAVKAAESRAEGEDGPESPTPTASWRSIRSPGVEEELSDIVDVAEERFAESSPDRGPLALASSVGGVRRSRLS